MWGWILYIHVWKVARVKEINVIRSELWLGVFIIIPGILMALEEELSVWDGPPCLLQEIKQILKAKEIIQSKIKPCKAPSAKWYLYKDICRSKSTQKYLLSFPPIHQFGLAGPLRPNNALGFPNVHRSHCWPKGYTYFSSYHLFFFGRLNLIVDHTCLRGTDTPRSELSPASRALGVYKAPYFWKAV